jgi:hypothetical protein
LPRVAATRRSRTALSAIEVSFSVTTEERADEPLVLAQETPAPVAPAPRLSASARRPAAARRDATAPAPSALPAPPKLEAPTPLGREPASTPQLDLSPLAAARSIVGLESGPSVPGAPPSAGGKRSLHLDLNRSILSAAQASRPARRDEAPVLTRQGDGSYAYESPSFEATIARDGTLHMDNKYGDVGLTFRPRRLADGTYTIDILRFGFDLTAIFEHWIGNDPYRSERKWFLDGTRELRNRLAEAAFKEHLAKGRIRLRRELDFIWNNKEYSIETKQRETFEVWDSCAEDEVGSFGRSEVQAYVEARCSLGSPCAFSAAELAALNAKRKSRAPFMPYRALPTPP